MMNVSSWSIKNPVPAVMLFVLLTFGGLLSFKAMKVQNFPDIDLPTVSVSAALPGAAPAQLETEVARKLENSIATVQGLKHITTRVQDGGGGNTYGGYSNQSVGRESFVLHIGHDESQLAAVTPLLCAGITAYSPLMQWGVGPGHKVGIVGLGGLVVRRRTCWTFAQSTASCRTLK